MFLFYFSSSLSQTDWVNSVKVLRLVPYKIRHFGDVLPSQSHSYWKTKSNTTKANMHPQQNIGLPQHKQVSAAADRPARRGFFTPTMLYTDVDGQCDKLVTDGRHQFITLTVHLSWQHLRRSTCSCEIFEVQSLGASSRGKYPYFWRYPNSLPTQCMIRWGKPLCQTRAAAAARSVQPFSYSADMWQKWGGLG